MASEIRRSFVRNGLVTSGRPDTTAAAGSRTKVSSSRRNR
jgi:hypothetical protein